MPLSPEATIEQSSDLADSPEQVWAHATSMAGINDELRPWLRMTAPAGLTDLASEPVLGRPWFHSWLLAFGVVPCERMHLCLVELDLEGRRLVEQSQMVWMRSWRHERAVEALEGGCRITDRVTPVPRIPGLGGVARAGVRALFQHRHRVLRARFGVLP